VIKKDNLVENARVVGEHLKNELTKIQNDNPQLISNVRGLGLMCSFDLPSPKLRDQFRSLCYSEKLIILGCGEKSIRFRPPLTVTKDEIDQGLNIIKKVLKLMMSNN